LDWSRACNRKYVSFLSCFLCTAQITIPTTGRLKSIMSPSEHLTPGILYVGIATLTGSVLSRTRSLPTRIILPPAFFFISLHHFLPQTTSNLTAYLSSLERAYIPAVAERHAVLNSWVKSGWEGARNGVERGRKEAMSTAEGLVRGVQNATGLKLSEVFGSAQSEESLQKRDETKAR
jgi:MICOS complex subunit MIC26